MKLHQADTLADWHKIPKTQQNVWQRYAYATHGVLTPGNLLSGLGLALVLWGLALLADGHAASGLVALGFGRLADIVDGVAAERTGTKSPLGELVDSTFDKIGVVATGLVFIVYGFTPWWLVVIILLQHLAIVVASVLARLRHVSLHPSRSGKLAMAGVWTALGLFGIAHLLMLHGWKTAEWAVLAGGYVMVAAALGLGTAAAISYYQQVLTAKA